MTAGRVTNLYDLMDAAYDAREIHQMSERLGDVAIIDVNLRRNKDLKEERDRKARARRAACHVDPASVRYRIRTVPEPPSPPARRTLTMFGILALTADQLKRLAAP